MITKTPKPANYARLPPIKDAQLTPPVVGKVYVPQEGKKRRVTRVEMHPGGTFNVFWRPSHLKVGGAKCWCVTWDSWMTRQNVVVEE